MEELKEFLVQAKKNTYAAKNKAKEIKIKGGGRILKFSKGNFIYQDKYFGTNPFCGEEIVLLKGKVIWGMNYYGKAEDKEVYKFLKRALMKVSKEKPFRGPLNLKEGDLEYKNKVSGSLKKFSGIEIVTKNKKGIYRRSYHGGFVK
jgi:hypothetical protein